MEHNLVVLEFVASNTVFASNKVAKVTNVAHLRGRAAVHFSVRVVVGSGSLAAFDEVA